MSDYVEPTIVPNNGPVSETTETHPAYAVAYVNRVSGNPPLTLFGSDFGHHRWIEVGVAPAELDRGNSNDHVVKRDSKEIVRFAMSENQWGEFVSSIGAAGGTQVTLQRAGGEFVPQIPRPKDRAEQFSTEARGRMEGSLAALKTLEAMIGEAGLSGVRKDSLLKQVASARAGISGSLDFVARQFVEHMEGVVSSARSEIQGALRSTLEAHGLDALAGPTPLALVEPAWRPSLGDPVRIRATHEIGRVSSWVTGGVEVHLPSGSYAAFILDELEPAL